MITAHFDTREYGPQSAVQMSGQRIMLARLWPRLRAALGSHGPIYTRADIAGFIDNGSARLWEHGESLALTLVQHCSTGFRIIHGWSAEGNAKDVRALVGIIETWARAAGINRMQVLGRRGMQAILTDFKPHEVLFLKEL